MTADSEAALVTIWLCAMYDALLTAHPQKGDTETFPREVCGRERLAPPFVRCLEDLQNATRWDHLPFYYDSRALQECSCFPIRKHAASRLLEELNGPYAPRIRSLVKKVAAVVSDSELHASLRAVLALKDMERVLRVLCHAYLTHLGKKCFGESDFASLVEKPVEALTQYACVEVVLLVTDAFEKEVADGVAVGRVAYPEYVGAALCALDGLDVTEPVAAALTRLGLSCWMTVLQRRRLFQCVNLWWTSRKVAFPVHEMYNWLLLCGENSFESFMELTRSLTDTTVCDVLRGFLAVPAPQRGPLGKLQDALNGNKLTKQAVLTYRTAWDAKRRQVVNEIKRLDQQQLRRTASGWERSWDDIKAFLRDERVDISAELVACSIRVYDDIRASSTLPDTLRKERLERFTKEYRTHAEAAASNDGKRRVKETEARILHSEDDTQRTLVDILLGYWDSKGYLPRRVQVLAVLALLQGSVLANINTSEGKTYVTGCVIAFKLYCGYRVAFATSSCNLAMEAMEFNHGAFTLLFANQLRAVAEDAETAKSSDAVYAAQMVYTTEGNVRARELRTLLDPTDERHYREWRGFAHWMIQDEADVSMVQSLTEAMYVGGPSLDARRDALTFPALMTAAISNDSQETAWEAWVKRASILSRDPKDSVLSQERFKRYAASAHDVWDVANNEDYVAVKGRSVPYNTETGETLYTTSLMDGLSTMTCMKEGQRWEWETEAAVTVNPLLLFSVNFKGRLTAVTGTAGGYATQAIYNRVYRLKPVVIPPAFFSLFQELPHELYSNAAAYDEGIERSIRGAVGRDQDVLVAVKTVAEADRLMEKVKALFARRPATTVPVYFQRYAREKTDCVPRLSAGVRHVFFMTFLGGRGLDVTPHDKQPNGIHVVLCCAQHERATHQVLRRAARQYHPGSGQIVCLLETQTATAADFTTDLMTREDFFKHQNKAVESERHRLQVLITTEIPQALLRQELQTAVQDCVRQLRNKKGLYLCASFVVPHCFATWLSTKRDAITQEGGNAACRARLVADLKRDVIGRFINATIDDVAALARLLRTTDERVVVATALRGTQLDLPWCAPRVYELFAGCRNGVCPYSIPELIHALEAASRGNIDDVRVHVLIFNDGLSRWIAAQEQLADDLNTMHREAGHGDDSDGGDAEPGGDLSSVHATTAFLKALQDHYLRLVGSNGVLLPSVFRDNGLSFADTMAMLEALVRHGFVKDPPCTVEKNSQWAAKYEAIQQVVPELKGKPCAAPPRSSLDFLRMCLRNRVAVEGLDAVFVGAAPLLLPLKVADAIFHEHVQTYAEKLKEKNDIPHVEMAVGILVGCAGLLRKDQVKRAYAVSTYVKFEGSVDSDTIWDWACFGYQHLVDVEERENSSKNQALIDEEERKKAEANSLWGVTKRFLWAAGKAIVDVGLSVVANTLFPGASFIIKNIVAPFIKSGIELAKTFIETGRMEIKKFFTEGLSGAAMNCAAAGLRKVGNWVAEKVGKSSVIQGVLEKYNAAKESVARYVHQAKKHLGKFADKLRLNNRLTQAAARLGGAMMLRSGRKAVTNAITKKCIRDYKQNVDEVIRKRLNAPLLVLMLTLKNQKPSQYERFLQQLVPHIQEGLESVNVVEKLLGGSSVVQTFDETLRQSCRMSSDETAAQIYALVDNVAFLRTACTGPKEAVGGVCDEYVSKSWAYATKEFAVDRTREASANGVSPDMKQSRVLSQFQQLILDRAVRPVRNYVDGVANSCIDSIRTAVDHIEQREQTALRLQKEAQTLAAQWTGKAVLHDSSRFTLHNSLVPGDIAGIGAGKGHFDAPKDGLVESLMSPIPKRGYFDRLIDAGEAVVDFLQSDVGKLLALSALLLSVRDRALVERLMRMLNGETVLPPVNFSQRPTLAETLSIIFMILYERFNVHRRLECSTLTEAMLELCIALVSAMTAARCSFDAEVPKLPLAYQKFGHLQTLFHKAAEYSCKAYEEAAWSTAKLHVKGKNVHDPTYQIYVDTSSELVVLAFRGTTTMLDILADCVCLSEPFCGAVAHCGFASIVKAFFEMPKGLDLLRRLAANHPTYNVLITGHSLGGSVAILTGLRLIHDHAVDEGVLRRLFVVAIAGAPATTHQFAETDSFFNIVNNMDCVPRAQLNSFDRLLQELLADIDISMACAPELVQPKNTFLVAKDDFEVRVASTAITSSIYCAPSMIGDHNSKQYLAILQ